MIAIDELLRAVDTAGTDIDAPRVNRIIELLTVIIGTPLVVPVEELQELPDRVKRHLELEGAPGSTARNMKYRLNRMLKMAVAQGLICENERRFETGIPIPPRPRCSGPDRRRYDALVAFERWCAQNRISLDEITTSVFSRYRNDLKSSASSDSWMEARYSDLVRAWREMAPAEMHPKMDLPRWNDLSRENYGLARDLWPMGCRMQFEAYERGARNQARSGEKRWRGPLRDVSIKDMEKEICQVLGYLSNVRKVLKQNDDLRSVLEKSINGLGFIKWHVKERCEGAEHEYHRSSLERYADMLEWLDGDSEACELYRRTARSIVPVRVRDPFPVRPMEYDEFVDAAMRALREKRAEFEEAVAKGPQARMRAACAFRDSMIFAFLVCRPVRSRNIREMQLGGNLFRDAKDLWRLRFLRHESKSRVYECAFPKVLEPWLQFYLDHVRPVLLKRGMTNVLFLTKSGRSISPQDLWRRLRSIGDKYLGIQTNPHLFRYLIPSAYLARYPDAILEMQALLGHGTMQTTLRCYVHTYSQVASSKVASAIREHCPNFTRLAALYPQPS